MEAMSNGYIPAEERVDQLANTNELAQILNVTTRTIGNLVQKRRIPVLKVGSLNRFNVQRVLESLEKKEAK
ncbi:helix-turn-helix domain-containing protein [bacterium]|jgi:excisionase family DNA binding protein|nr:helix-turn-helix domain-containing protein [bacterium]|tara:strand:+ start:223 stop:435 length:213 start_codon:yes stop_codon:yes gene_type:complete